MTGAAARLLRERAARVVKTLIDRSLSLALAESSTGGLLADLLTDVPGASGCLLGGVIAYDNRAKVALLGVRERTLVAEGAVSAAVAAEMAVGAQTAFAADLGIAVTGIAGPGGGTRQKPVGLTFVALAADGQTTVEQATFAGGGRRRVKAQAVSLALDLLLRHLETAPSGA